MKILGICHDVLICSAALLIDGQVVAAIAEERLDRQKQSRHFPALAVQRCLSMAEVKFSDLDEVAVAWNPSLEMDTVPSGFLSRRWRSEHLSQVAARFSQLFPAPPSPELQLLGVRQGLPPITFVDHYHAHLGNALYLSPFETCAVAVLDGRGEKQTSLLGLAEGTRFTPLSEVKFPHSLGLFYGAVTQHLGFKPDGDEWKVMALASFASPDNAYLDAMRQLVRLDGRGGFELDLGSFEFFNFFEPKMYSQRYIDVFGPPRRRDQPLEVRHYELAAAAQKVFEDAVSALLHWLHEQTGQSRLVVGGGCFMNSAYNGKITSQTPFRECFVGSCPDDSGTSLGAALWLHAQRTGQRPGPAMSHNYWGPAYSDEECLSVARRYKLGPLEVCDDPGQRAAQDLLSGHILGWFQGAMEFGQRALGNRSILLDPRRSDGKDVVNSAVKFREHFRPFAPAILAEHVSQWFECEADTRVPFMEKVLPFRPGQGEKVPAVLHVDGTGRLQTVDEHSAPRYRRLIQCFHEETGVPIVLNTSFNLNGEAICCTPEDALRSFFTCGLDVLYLGNVRISKIS